MRRGMLVTWSRRDLLDPARNLYVGNARRVIRRDPPCREREALDEVWFAPTNITFIDSKAKGEPRERASRGNNSA